MPEAKQAILAAHQAASASALGRDCISEAAIRAVCQGLSAIHVEAHALGLVFYGLTALYQLTPLALLAGSH
ncbi:hypothetical protein SDC9_109589 [bioreactor metagenome]|uniref:Imm-5-like domain-containing protein n=1 Tax=bioreactor metagenome TaxID=1076179 RepID=A0A645BBL9_9ZZZZ|nr:hypothetical protein [Erysipelotrichaceae bacterium]